MLVVLMGSMSFSATADQMSTQYMDCLDRLNNYLLNTQSIYIDLNQLQRDFEALGNYSNGECSALSMYTQVLINLRDSRYTDCEMYLQLLQNYEQKINAVIYTYPQYSAIGSVSMLKTYYDARVYELQGNYNAAFDLYSTVSMFYDSLARAQYSYNHRDDSTTSAEQNVIGKRVKIVKSANVRTGPGTSYDRIDGVGVGSSFKILDCKKATNGYAWYQIEVSGMLGWICETQTNLGGGSGSSNSKDKDTDKKSDKTDTENDTDIKNDIDNSSGSESNSGASSTSGSISGSASSSEAGSISGSSSTAINNNSVIINIIPKEDKWSAWSAWSTTPVSSSSTRDVDTKIEYEPIYVTKYHYRHWKYYNTSAKAYWYSYSEYKGANYKKDSGKWEYKTTTSPLKKKTVIDGRQQYEGYWYLYDTTTEQNGTKAITYYRYRDKLN